MKHKLDNPIRWMVENANTNGFARILYILLCMSPIWIIALVYFVLYLVISANAPQ